MPEDEINISWVSAFASREYESDEDLLGRFRSLEDLSSPQGFKNRIVDIDTEDPVESELYIGKSGSEPPSNQTYNVVEVGAYDFSDLDFDAEEDEEVTGEGRLRITATFEGEFTDELQTIYNEIIAKVEPLTLDTFSLAYRHDNLLEDLKTPLDWDSDVEISGVRFKKEGLDYLIQSLPNDNGVTVRNFEKPGAELTSSGSDEFIQDKITKARQAINELEK